MRVLLLAALAGTAMSQCALTGLYKYTTSLDATFDALGYAKSGELYDAIAGTGGAIQGGGAGQTGDFSAGDGDVACNTASGKAMINGGTVTSYACATTTWTDITALQCCNALGCSDVTSCTDQTVANTVCATAAAGYWVNSNVATACTTITGEASGATYTCTSAANSRVSACIAGRWKDGTGTADVCTPCTAVSNAHGSATITCTSAANSAISACADGFFKVTTGTANVCTACTPISGGTAVTCAALTQSQATGCGSHFVFTDNTAPVADTCVIAVGYWDDGGTGTACVEISGCAAKNAAGHTCTSATNEQCAACKANYSLTDNTAPTADLCAADAGYYDNSGTAAACTAVTNCGVDETCTANNNSKCTTCAAGYFKTAGTADTCTACDAVAGCTQANIVCTSASDEKCHKCDAGYTLTVAAGTCAAVTVPTNSGTPAGDCNTGYHASTATDSTSSKAVTAGICSTDAWVYANTCVADAWATTCAAGTKLLNGVCDGACTKAGAATYTANKDCAILTCATGYTIAGTGDTKTCGGDGCGTPTNAATGYGSVAGLTTGTAVAIPVLAGYVVAAQDLACTGANLDMASLATPTKITCAITQYPDGSKGCTACPTGLKLAAAKSAWLADGSATAVAGTAAGDCTVVVAAPAHARITTAASASTPTNAVVACYPGYTGTLTYNAVTGAWDGTCAAYVPNVATCKTEAAAHYYATQKAANLGQCANPSTFTAPCATTDANMAACLVKLDAWKTAAEAKCDAFATANTANAGYVNNLTYESLNAAVIAATGLASYNMDTRYAALMTDGHVFHEAVETALAALSTKTVATYDSGEGVVFYSNNAWDHPAGTAARAIADMSIRDLIAMATHEPTIKTAIDALTPAAGNWEANDDAALEAIRAAITAAATPTAQSSAALASAGVVALAVGAAQLFM